MSFYPYTIKPLNSTYFVFVALWATLWLSLNAESAIEDGRLLASFNGCRLLLPYFTAGVTILWLCRLRIIPKIHIWQAAALGYAGTVLISGVIAELSPEYLHFHAAIVCTIIVTICGKTVAHKEGQINERQIAIFLIFTGLFILSIVFSIFFLRDLIQAAQHGIYSGYKIQATVPHQFGMEAPRPTGNARTAAIIGTFCLILYGFGIVKHRIFYVISCICFAALIFYQARGTWVALLITAPMLLKIIPITDRPSLGNIFRFIAISTGLLFIIWLTIHGAASITDNSKHVVNSDLFRDFTQKNNLTSGRLSHWENGLNAFLTSPLFGLGGQADRMHIDHNVSNMLIYILMCGGLIGLIFAALSIVKPLNFIWKLSRNKTENKNNVENGITLCAIATFIFLSVRGLFENSYSLFNIDFLLVVPTIWYLSLQHDEKQKNKL